MTTAKSKADLLQELDRLHAVQRWALRSESASRLHAMLDLARSEPGVPVLPDDFDRDPWLLNCPNGTLDLKTGILREHRREDFITKMCPVIFDANAACPRWEQFLKEIFAEDAALTTYIQRLIGWWLTGDVSENLLPIFWGQGDNGKTTLLNVILEMLGPDYAMKAVHDFLMKKSGSEHSTSKMDLFRKRLVVAAESDEGRRLDEAFIKELTGRERIRGRRMYENNWEFDPTHKIVLCTNHKPVIKGTEHAIWRRIRLVPFAVRIPEHQKDKQLAGKLTAESEGILAWAVRGCLDWQAHGLGAPAPVTNATAEYRAAEDLLEGFIGECCETGPNYSVQATPFYIAFKEWCERTGEKYVSQKQFGEALTEKGYSVFKSGVNWRLGIQLSAAYSPPEP